MSRPLRVEFPGAIYHVTSRGNERHKIFRDDDDRRLFLATLDEATKDFGLRVHGYCLMPNHYHLIFETPHPNLSRAMGWFQTTYTVRFNRRHRRSGHLYQGRFKAQVVDAEDYARQLLCYLHLNPVRLRDKNAIIPRDRRRVLEKWPWSSHRAYLGLAKPQAWLCTDWLSFFGRTPAQARRAYTRLIDQTFGKRPENPWDQIQSGIALGGEKLQRKVRSIIEKKSGNEPGKTPSRPATKNNALPPRKT